MIAGSVVVGLVVLAWVTFSDGESSGHRHDSSPAAATAAGPTVRYLYTRSFVRAPARAVLGTPATGVWIENWVGSDGSWRLRQTVPGRTAGSLNVVVAADGLLPPQANATAAFDGVPVNPRDPGDGLLNARQLDALPVQAAC